MEEQNPKKPLYDQIQKLKQQGYSDEQIQAFIAQQPPQTSVNPMQSVQSQAQAAQVGPPGVSPYEQAQQLASQGASAGAIRARTMGAAQQNPYEVQMKRVSMMSNIAIAGVFVIVIVLLAVVAMWATG